MSTRCLPDVCQIVSDVYQMSTRSYQMSVYQKSARSYQMSSRCLPEVYQMFTRCLSDVAFAIFDQCMYHLLPPDDLSGNNRVRKSTRILSNLYGIEDLSVRCDGNHFHSQAIGHVRIGDKSISRAKAAGHYPDQLCAAVAKLVSASVARARAVLG